VSYKQKPTAGKSTGVGGRKKKGKAPISANLERKRRGVPYESRRGVGRAFTLGEKKKDKNFEGGGEERLQEASASCTEPESAKSRLDEKEKEKLLPCGGEKGSVLPSSVKGRPYKQAAPLLKRGGKKDAPVLARQKRETH